jgi:omega-6 fatty acid desaturase (delta-12 desaturase)
VNEALAIPAAPAFDKAAWKAIVARFQEPSRGRAVWQIINTFIPYMLLWYLMYLGIAHAWWVTLPLALLAAAFLVRIFIIFHDCGHGSYFKSQHANDVLGFIAGVLTFTPYYHWRWEHAVHHGSTGNLERRGVGDVWTMTVQEYLKSSRWNRLTYRLTRNPFILFVVAPAFIFIVWQRFPSPQASPRERRSVWWMNLAIACYVVMMCAIFGVGRYLLIQSIVMVVSSAAGVWLFYIQHQFEDAYWERGENWDYTAAALQGSSFYKLPKVLQWFSGNIGFHHIHHLSPRIPNYNLQRCHEADPLFQKVRPVTLFGSLRSLKLRLWDEKAKQLVSFRRARRELRDAGKHKPLHR